MDNPLIVGPEPDSKIIGWAQGIYGSTSFEEVGLLMILNLVFDQGEYNGSTLIVLGHNSILHKYREMPIVGGLGVFHLARGIATAQTVWFNLTTKLQLLSIKLWFCIMIPKIRTSEKWCLYMQKVCNMIF
ncbi:hypothetical protein ACS0TY_005428 [Phlomoides rotata]